MTTRSRNAQRSILDDLGEEVTSILTPVTVCMALTVLLVKTLNPTGASDARSVYIASAFYTEKVTDSVSTKTFGALINATAFVAIVTLMTFLLVFLFKRGYTGFIYGYMCFAGFSIFFVLAGILLLQLLEKFDTAIDAISYLFLLYNFAVVGVLALFVWPAPMTLKQIYLTITGVIVAYVFTWTPEWTTWALLVAMAIYDIFAVLMPGGPLKELVQIAEERQVDIPALVYEARPVRRNSAEHLHEVASDSAWAHAMRPRRMHDVTTGNSVTTRADASAVSLQDSAASEDGLQQVDAEVSHVEAAAVGGQQMPVVRSPAGPGRSTAQLQVQDGPHTGPPHPQQGAESPDCYDGNLLPDAIKLGLGDFIFYSVLVGRAVMYDMLTAYMAYLAIVAGLGMTLLLLALYQKALPALPVSISFGVAFYFAARLLLEPFVLPLSTGLVFF